MPPSIFAISLDVPPKFSKSSDTVCVRNHDDWAGGEPFGLDPPHTAALGSIRQGSPRDLVCCMSFRQPLSPVIIIRISSGISALCYFTILSCPWCRWTKDTKRLVWAAANPALFLAVDECPEVLPRRFRPAVSGYPIHTCHGTSYKNMESSIVFFILTVLIQAEIDPVSACHRITINLQFMLWTKE